VAPIPALPGFQILIHEQEHYAMGKFTLTPDVMEMVAERFKALAEPARLQLLSCLKGGELTVNELVEESGLGQANVSKHLRLLHGLGFVTRRKEGLFVYYALADASVFKLCDIMCGRIEAQVAVRQRQLAS
jgi:DNA-binding transcriptional ArsR family regulator